MKNQIIIRTKDIQRIEDVTYRTAQRRMAAIRKHFNFRPKFITVQHYASYCGLSVNFLQKLLE